MYNSLSFSFQSTNLTSHIILCLESAVQVYSISTSHAVRGLRSCDNTRISGCVLSPIDDEIAYVSTSGGAIAEWNWTTGDTQRTMQLEGSYLLSLKVVQCPHTNGNEEEDTKDVTIFALVMRNGKREISINSFDKPGDQPQNNGPKHHSVILETSTQINDFRLAAGGSVIIAIAGSSLIIGHRARGPEREPEYTWREVQLPFTTTSFDIREPDRESSTKKGNKKPVVDLAVGQNEGAIIVYSDVLNTLKGLENRRIAEPGASSLKLHWHRGPVKTVRWSKDGIFPSRHVTLKCLCIIELTTAQEIISYLVASKPSWSSGSLILGENNSCPISLPRYATSLSPLRAAAMPLSFRITLPWS